MQIEGDEIRLTFDHAGSGLASRDGQPLNWFEIIDADEGGFVEGTAKIDGDAIVISAPGVKKPVAVRFAWHKLAEPNLMNKEGLPAAPFRMGEVPQRDLLEMEVPESGDYQLVYDLDLATLGEMIDYDVDNSGEIRHPFDRIAYFVELQRDSGDIQYLYVSLDAFTDDAKKIGVPTFASGGHFQQDVAHMNVWSNVNGIITGRDLEGGGIEFWSQNYAPSNAASVPGASSSLYDFGDQPADPADGYGSMQIHNRDAQQTLFAVNHWSQGEQADIGIGNRSESHPDWTFAGNAHTYLSRRLRVLVRTR